MTGSAVTDPLIGAVSCPTGTLDPDATIVCRGIRIVTALDVARGSFTNTATAHGIGANEQPPLEAFG
ncbi:DUF7507 domain-containing protein [Streptosporangium sp. NBC_01756]|uniref:DUF7507 domain-containing protein n=1 Tax=Streptosporangium sp. NBC_01756 TaxID=2975950 RepID=UPI002DDBCB67|nr:hypothetical protein [Streptosporangium sp. NBC_01756]WSC86791.1 hypothetical protein OIE48_00805 [Streptosporangium sp. NBC_01756]